MFSRHVWSTVRHAKASSSSRCSARSLATVTDSPASPSSTQPRQLPKPGQQSPEAVICTGVILNRSPFLTRTPTPFERAYYAYHSRVQRALSNPFPSEFYFKPGSLLEGQFVEEEEERERAAFGGPISRKDKDSGDPLTDSPAVAGASVAAATQGTALAKEEEYVARRHEADAKGDVRSLDRQGERNVYLLVNGMDSAGKSVWKFPEGGIKPDESLHKAAERDLIAQCGEKMDTWMVARKPVGVYSASQLTTPVSTSAAQTCIFFYKAHILAGQVHPDGKNITDFAWLTKEEIEPRVDEQYWSGVKDMLSDF